MAGEKGRKKKAREKRRAGKWKIEQKKSASTNTGKRKNG